MPGRILPTFSPDEVRSRKTADLCYVTIGSKVYDVTEFLEGHPGGPELVLEYGGQDVTEILKDEASHFHTESAYEMLEELHIGFVATEAEFAAAANAGKAGGQANGTTAANGAPVFTATGMSSAADLERETDYSADYKAHKFLDLNKPLLMQVLRGNFSKEFYLEQIHRPRHYKGGQSAPLFGNFLEPLSKTAWWVIPTIWLPCVAYGTYVASQGLDFYQLVPYWIFGTCFWTLVEYCLHRFLFHIDGYLPDHSVFLTLHFLLHGIHHYLPMDKYRLVMPPTLFVVLAAPFWKLAHAIFFYNWYAATAVYCGGIFGYVCYDLTHYFLHHKTLPSYYRELKKYHLEHHFADYENGFGVTSRFWDRVFNTEINLPPKVVKTL